MKKEDFEEKKEVSITSYSFPSLIEDDKNHDHNHEVSKYKISELGDFTKKKEKELIRTSRKERMQLKDQSFKTSPVVKSYRGINKIEEEEFENKVAREVRRRLNEVKADAYKEGFESGEKLGKSTVEKKLKIEAKEKIQKLSQIVLEIKEIKTKVLKGQINEIYELIKTLTKWITLKELKNDGSYIKRLLEKMIIELQVQDHFLIQIEKKSYERMPEILEELEKSVGEMKNVRVEYIQDEDAQGAFIESENGILNGTLSSQFKKFDELFSEIDLDIYDQKIQNSSSESKSFLSGSNHPQDQIIEDDQTEENSDLELKLESEQGPELEHGNENVSLSDYNELESESSEKSDVKESENREQTDQDIDQSLSDEDIEDSDE